MQPGCLNHTLLSQSYVLENSSHLENSGQECTFQRQGEVEEPLITQEQLTGQAAVTSSL